MGISTSALPKDFTDTCNQRGPAKSELELSWPFEFNYFRIGQSSCDYSCKIFLYQSVQAVKSIQVFKRDGYHTRMLMLTPNIQTYGLIRVFTEPLVALSHFHCKRAFAIAIDCIAVNYP